MVVNSLKTATARLLRRDHAAHLKKLYWKPVLGSRKYIRQQAAPH